MSLLYVVVTLIVVGVLLWALNTYGGQVIDGKILKLINIVVMVVIVIWLLQVFGLFGHMSSIRVG
jgi:hypothetical protein